MALAYASKLSFAALLLFTAGCASLSHRGQDPAGLIPKELRCEYLRDPLGVQEARPRLSWIVESPQRGQKQTAWRIIVASTPQLLAKNAGDLWDSGKTNSDQTAHIEYGGKPLASRQGCFWKVQSWDRDNHPGQWSAPARWEMGLLASRDWNAKWIQSNSTTSIPYLRKTFAIAKPIRQARVYVTALGLYEMRLNGQRVGDHVLAPDWTDYRKRVQYQVYDVTSQLIRGENAIGAQLANGWYSGHIGNGGFQHWGKVPALVAQVEIVYDDGTTDRIVSDESWKSHDSPQLSSDFMAGEGYDARKEIAAWDRPGIDERNWAAVVVRDESDRSLDAQLDEPVRELLEIKPKAITEPSPGKWVFDLGQNMVGVARLNVSASAGTRITLHHAEMLNPDGQIYTANLRGAAATDSYICRGGAPETWQPKFTFHGFRYVEVTGLPTKPTLDTITGIVIGSDTPAAGEFACSDPRLNQLQSNIVWGQRGNYLSIPTDCPQRDERLGWMGDAQVFVRTATYNMDVAAFFSKWLIDVDDAQRPDGPFTDVSPDTGMTASVPGWADAGVICPWTIYLSTGDKSLLAKHLPAMTRWVDWCRAHSTNLIRDHDRGNDYGDWLSINADTPKDVIGTAYFAYSTHLLAQSYRAVGDNAKADKYEQLFAEIQSAFNRAFVTNESATGLRIKGDTQTDYAMALAFDLLPESLRAAAADRLESDIRAKGWHLSTGFLGVSYLLPVLTANGKIDTAYRLLMQDTFPSWLFSVKHGATTIWERWDGWTPQKGFQDPGMNSFNHYALGSCGQWLFETVAGISLDAQQPGFSNILIHPRPGGGISWVRGRYRSIRGPIESNWTAERGTFSLHIKIPANATATVFLPGNDPSEIRESGKLARQSNGVKFLRQQDGEMVYEIESGSYVFTAPFR